MGMPRPGAFYVFGGSSLATAERYDIESDVWTSLPSMSSKRCRHAAVSFGGAVYVFGGYDGTNYLSSVEKYDVKTGEWKSWPPMTLRRCDLAAVACGDTQ